MGISEKDQEETLKKETQAIIDALTPEEQHKLKMIREKLEKEGTSEQALSIKLAWAEACGMLINVPCVPLFFAGIPTDETMTVPDPDAMKEATNKAAEQIRERVLNNPVFA